MIVETGRSRRGGSALAVRGQITRTHGGLHGPFGREFREG